MRIASGSVETVATVDLTENIGCNGCRMVSGCAVCCVLGAVGSLGEMDAWADVPGCLCFCGACVWLSRLSKSDCGCLAGAVRLLTTQFSTRQLRLIVRLRGPRVVRNGCKGRRACQDGRPKHGASGTQNVAAVVAVPSVAQGPREVLD